MFYTKNDIDVFIITYNRVDIISETIDSVLNQTVGDLSITIVDNGSCDNTEELIKSKYKTINYIKEDKNIGTQIFKKIKSYITKPLLMVFHDDDILASSYIEYSIEKFNKYENLNLILCYTKCLDNLTDYRFPMLDKVNYTNIGNSSCFTKLFFLDYPIPFCSAIYKSNIYIENELNLDKYGKIFDRPFLINCISNGSVIIFKSKFIITRIHEKQDTKTISSGPFDLELINLARFYKNELNTSLKNIFIWNLLIVTKIFLWDEWINKRSSISTKIKLLHKFKKYHIVKNVNYFGLAIYFVYYIYKKFSKLYLTTL